MISISISIAPMFSVKWVYLGTLPRLPHIHLGHGSAAARTAACCFSPHGDTTGHVSHERACMGEWAEDAMARR